MDRTQSRVVIDDSLLERFSLCIDKMKSYGVKAALVEFYGGGDCGQIENVNIEPDPPEMCRVSVTEEKYIRDYNEETKQYDCRKENVTKLMTLEQALEALTYQALDETNVDWYNNEGGGGSLEIELSGDTPQIKFHVYYNVVESVTEVDKVVELKL